MLVLLHHSKGGILCGAPVPPVRNQRLTCRPPPSLPIRLWLTCRPPPCLPICLWLHRHLPCLPTHLYGSVVRGWYSSLAGILVAPVSRVARCRGPSQGWHSALWQRPVSRVAQCTLAETRLKGGTVHLGRDPSQGWHSALWQRPVSRVAQCILAEARLKGGTVHFGRGPSQGWHSAFWLRLSQGWHSALWQRPVSRVAQCRSLV